MSLWLDFIASARFQPLVFALLHTLWIGILAVGLLAVVLRRLPASQASLRYVAAMLTQLSIVLAAVVMWVWLDHAATQPALPTAVVGVAESGDRLLAGGAEQPAGEPIAVPGRLNQTTGGSTAAIGSGPRARSGHGHWVPYLGGLWLVGVVLMLVRMTLAVADAGRLVRHGCRADPSTVAFVDRLRKELGIARRVRVVTSQLCDCPVVAGVVWPTIVLPVSLLTELPPQAIRAILLHELAHIRRHDYLLNLMQMLVESVLFFNPAIWWVSRQIRIEREACCDALAVRATGEPIVYSQALAAWAERLRRSASDAPISAAAMAISGRRSGMLLGRIRRVLYPAERPTLHVSPASLLGLLVLTLIAVGAVWQGTHLAVSVAAQILSPAERVERVAEKVAANAPPRRSRADDPVTLIGTVRTEDGRSLPKPLRASSYSRSGNSSTMSAEGEFGETFKVTTSPGIVWLLFKAEGYGPGVAGPFNVESGEVIDDIEIVLPIGFSVEFVVADEDGNPVPDADVSAGYITGGGASNALQARSDRQGHGVLSHAIEGEYFVSAKAAGFQDTGSDRMHIQRGETLPITLKRALPVTGQVVAADGRPIAAATIRAFVTRSERRGGSHIHGPVGDQLATTDDAGRFVLDQLVGGSIYDVLVGHPEHGRRVHEGIQPGQQDLQLDLGPNLTLEGTLHGDLASLPRRRGEPSIKVRQVVPLGPDGIRGWYSDQATVEPTETGGRFVVSGLLPAKTTVTAGEHEVTLDLSEARQQVTIDLTQPTPTTETRQVELVFESEAGALPRGSVEIHTTSLEERVFRKKEVVPLQEGRARFEVTVGVEVNVQSSGLIGYWFEDTSFPVPDGGQPKQVFIDTIAAGAVSGQVLLADGSPATDISINIRAVDKPESLRMESITPSVAQRVDADGRFVITPLPLDATYVITAGRGHNRTVSDPVRLTAAAPTREASLKFAPDTTAAGIVLGPDGDPLANIPLQLELDHPHAGTTWSPGFVTDRNGRFRITRLGSTLDGYRIRLAIDKDYQPQVIPLNPGGPPVTMKLERGLVLHGRVLDAATRRPIPGVELYAYPIRHEPSETYSYGAEGKTAADGTFRFSNLAKQPYQINDRSGLKWNKQTAANVVPGQEKPLVIEATLPEWSRLKVAE